MQRHPTPGTSRSNFLRAAAVTLAILVVSGVLLTLRLGAFAPIGSPPTVALADRKRAQPLTSGDRVKNSEGGGRSPFSKIADPETHPGGEHVLGRPIIASEGERYKTFSWPTNASAVAVFGISDTVDVQWSESACRGKITLRVRADVGAAAAVSGSDACRAAGGGGGDRILSRDSKLDSELRRVETPHLFRLRLDGPAIMTIPSNFGAPRSLSAQSAAVCEYEFSIPAALSFPVTDAAANAVMPARGGAATSQRPLPSGDYRVGLELLYSGFAHVDETDDVWPPLLKAPILNVDYAAVHDIKYHHQQLTLPSVHSLQCRRDDDQGAVPGEIAAPCTGLEPDTSGHWLREPAGGEVMTRVRVRKIRREPILFEWASQAEAAAVWSPNVCLQRRVDPARFLAAFNGRRIVVGGDSQLRALYYAVVNFLRGDGDRCVRNITTLEQEPPGCVQNVKGSQRKKVALLTPSSGTGSTNSVQLDYVDDLFLSRLAKGRPSSSRYASYDVVIVGFAQHPASKEHWSEGKYVRAMHERMATLAALCRDFSVNSTASADDKGARGQANCVWYGAPEYPHTRAGFPVAVRDWRTPRRLERFNTAAFDAARSLGIPVVDAFRITSPFQHTSPDQAHFSNFVAVELVHQVLTVLCSSLHATLSPGASSLATDRCW